ncbi:SIP domain-containing protein [Galbitalea sp. SE-J8]|uniref:SIP domain-containing protein n=1 Tax=Galbitalea sp. SE-J8 TaxID=3054952 RepID=UPI00259D0E03|nr:SIP domain-containing protein [Galbitalea sp. SE-J8]MDM4764172.1 SIP domain-containing protein [Galbitalea sp. SE-J8]
MLDPEQTLDGWNPDADDRLLIAGDERSLPCIRTMLAMAGPKQRGQVFVEVQSDADVAVLDAPGRFSVSWLVRDRGQSLTTSVDAWLSEMLPVTAHDDYSVYAWIVGSTRVLTSN